MQISSENKTILVFSDPHQEIHRVKKILERESYDEVVCLGDWFDSHFYTGEKFAADTARFLRDFLFQKGVVTLSGNHELPHLYNNNNTTHKGFSYEDKKSILNVFGDNLVRVRDKFRWYVWIDDFLCTHSGVHTYFFPPSLELSKKGVSDWLEKEGEEARKCLLGGGLHWFYRAGEARGGYQRIGGIVWADFRHEFEPIEGLKQLVGHTSHRKVVGHHTDGLMDLTQAQNLCIDCNLNQYLLIRDGKMQIKNSSDLE